MNVCSGIQARISFIREGCQVASFDTKHQKFGFFIVMLDQKKMLFDIFNILLLLPYRTFSFWLVCYLIKSFACFLQQFGVFGASEPAKPVSFSVVVL